MRHAILKIIGIVVIGTIGFTCYSGITNMVSSVKASQASSLDTIYDFQYGDKK